MSTTTTTTTAAQHESGKLPLRHLDYCSRSFFVVLLLSSSVGWMCAAGRVLLLVGVGPFSGSCFSQQHADHPPHQHHDDDRSN